MGLEYCYVHLVWTTPPALLMTFIYWPFYTRLELCKISTLIVIAVLATIPWDSYLIHNNIWSYPADAVAGPTLFAIPLEEVFFFVIQTYNTALLYVMLTKRLVLSTYLQRLPDKQLPIIGTLVILSGVVSGAAGVLSNSRYTYLGLILVWVCPVMMLQWVICCRFLLALPRKEIFLSIAVPSLYLCVVDNLALQRGTWVIENDTKLDLQIWGALDVEEAVFFFLTNVMIVFGLAAIDHAVAIAEYQIASSPGVVKQFPSFSKLMLLYLSDRPEHQDLHFLQGLALAVDMVSQKSQSMYTGSAMFQGGLRIDLLLLYSFCRVMDDLVDEAPDRQAAHLAIQQCTRALRSQFSRSATRDSYKLVNLKEHGDEDDTIPPYLLSSIALLPASRLAIDPFLHLLSGFKTDLLFSPENQAFPIATEEDLETYAYNVAGSVAASILELVFMHYQPACSKFCEQRNQMVNAGEKMGQALQYVNIARDIEHDAAIGRVYIPTSWLIEEGLRPVDVLAKPGNEKITKLRHRMLDKADAVYHAAVGAIDGIPSEARGPIRTVVESYMMIGKMVRKTPNVVLRGKGKLKLSPWRRLGVARRAMCNM